MHGSALTLRDLAPGYRVLYTGILIFFVAGYAAGLVQQHLRAGLSPAGVAAWYLGNADDPEADRLLFAKEGDEVLDSMWRRSLADVLPAIVLVALLTRATVPSGLRGALAAGIAGLAIADIMAPAAVALGGRAWAGAAFAAQVGLAATTLATAVVCLRDLLRRGLENPGLRGSNRKSP